MTNCICIKEIKEMLKGLGGYGVRCLTQKDGQVSINDLYVDSNNVLSLEQYEDLDVKYFNSEEEVMDILESSKMWCLKEDHDLGELQFMSNVIINSFDIEKLVEMPMHQTEVEFATLGLKMIAYLVKF